MILQKLLTYSLFKWFCNRFFHFFVHNESWFVKKNVNVSMKKYEKNSEMTNKKMFILKLSMNHFFLQFFLHVFFFYINWRYGRINNLNNIQCCYWIGGRCGWIADLDYHLQHWNSCLGMPVRIAWTVRGGFELITEFHWFFYQIDCFHSGIDFGSKCRIRRISHHFEMMKNKIKVFYWFSNIDCV